MGHAAPKARQPGRRAPLPPPEPRASLYGSRLRTERQIQEALLANEQDTDWAAYEAEIMVLVRNYPEFLIPDALRATTGLPTRQNAGGRQCRRGSGKGGYIGQERGLAEARWLCLGLPPQNLDPEATPG